MTLSCIHAGVYLVLNESVLEVNSTSLPARDVQTVHCHSDNKDAFSESQQTSAGWTFPNGTKVLPTGEPVTATIDTRGRLALTRVGNSSLPAGQYCCRAKDARNQERTVCIQVEPGETIQVESQYPVYIHHISIHCIEPSAVAGTVIGGVVAAIVVILVILVIIGAVIFWMYR